MLIKKNVLQQFFLYVALVFILFLGFNNNSAQAAEFSNRKSIVDSELDYVEKNFDRLVLQADNIVANLSEAPATPQYKKSENYYVKPVKEPHLKPLKKSKESFQYKNTFLKFDLETLGGFRKDDIDWNIAGNAAGTNPNILSELKWEDLEMSQTTVKSRMIFFEHFTADARGSYADIYEGKNQDSDYLGNNRTLEFSRSNNNSSDGEAWDLGGSFGFRFPLKPNDDILDADNVWVTLLGGYSHHEQHLIITDGLQTIPAAGAFQGLHSTYKTEWKGPFVGLEFEAKKNKFTGFLRGEYHWVDYYGHANWNLRQEFSHPKSFEHIAKGDGVVFHLGGGYQLTDWWALNVEGTIQRWKTDSGIDRVFFFNIPNLFIETRLNEVQWTSYSVMLGTTLSLF